MPNYHDYALLLARKAFLRTFKAYFAKTEYLTNGWRTECLDRERPPITEHRYMLGCTPLTAESLETVRRFKEITGNR